MSDDKQLNEERLEALIAQHPNDERYRNYCPRLYLKERIELLSDKKCGLTTVTYIAEQCGISYSRLAHQYLLNLNADNKKPVSVDTAIRLDELTNGFISLEFSAPTLWGIILSINSRLNKSKMTKPT